MTRGKPSRAHKQAATGEHGLVIAAHGRHYLVEREGGGFLQVSGLRMVFDPRGPAGRRILAVEVAGAPLDAARTYTVAAVEYVVRGGDGITALRDAQVLVAAESGPQISDVLLPAITARGTIAPQTDGRLTAR